MLAELIIYDTCLVVFYFQAFEKDADTNDKEASDEVFAQIMHLMQSMQLLGNPPKELVGEAPLPTSPEECSIS